jgi:hypothetical protein
MMIPSYPLARFAAALVLSTIVEPLRGGEPVRTFPDFGCRYTLPSDSWSWCDQPRPNMLFMAQDSRGLVIFLSYLRLPRPTDLDQKFADGFEKTFYSAGHMTKRSGRFTTFRGVPCYQTEGTFVDGRTTATRVFLAHGVAYHLSLLGTDKPIEQDADFDPIMNGFSFTTPPAPETEALPSEHPEGVSERMGALAADCLLIAGALVLLRWVFGKKAGGQSATAR